MIIPILFDIPVKQMRQASGILPPHKQAERFLAGLLDAHQEDQLNELINQGGTSLGITYIEGIGLLFLFHLPDIEVSK